MSGAPTLPSLFQQRVVVGVGDLAVSNNGNVNLSTFALGSCVGIIVYDKEAKVGGLIHIMLPDSTLSPEKAQKQPAMFADTGMPIMFRNLCGLRAERRRMRAFVAGGASVISGSDMFKIGERNILAVKKLINALGIQVVKADVGGVNNRTIHLNVGTGEVTLKTPLGTSKFSLA
ncbi:chemotaxis protein CheD [Pelagicoccus sp. SDUM812005]|uniref:chemotaxis protein CheD n=1 Tax=Pelagicoccus sp. SDUM812005 TaxID=3041257 RepID=UPI00280FA588|nr:chemotaxis protein CheD [Pelagicoccus sp. SDUM812005]MDQ8180951.1 chemotaxis protein CheD [Pelagicoccus sp. SDUM812005]